jgi:hypothetical protein
MSDAYRYWRDALEGRFGPVHTDDPRPGFYRTKIVRGKDSPWTPVAIWQSEDGTLTALRHHFVVEAPLIVDPNEIWTFCADYPITEEAYRAVAEHKRPWPDGSLSKRRERNEQTSSDD